MGWEVRQGRRYYYKTSRIGGRVVKRYFGHGEVARMAERLETEARGEAAAEVVAIQAEQDRLGPVEGFMRGLDRNCHRMIAATLMASGFHQHCRSWRKNRASRSSH